MGMVLMTGFEAVEAEHVWIGADWGSGWTFQTYDKRSGSYALRITNSASDFANPGYILAGKNLTEYYFQFAFKFDGSQSYNWSMFRSQAGATVMLSLKFDPVALLWNTYIGTGTLAVPGVTVCPTGKWYVIEIHHKIDDTVGVLETRIDGLSQGIFNGDTKPGTENYVDRFGWGRGSVWVWLDDIILNDTTGTLNNSWPNGLKVVRLAPTADGATKQWTPSTGTDHYTLVDEVPSNAADYIRSLTAGQVEELALGDLPVEALSVAAIKCRSYGAKGSVNSPTQLKLGVRKNGSNYMSAAKNLMLYPAETFHFVEADPETGSFLTPATVNDMQLVLESAG